MRAGPIGGGVLIALAVLTPAWAQTAPAPGTADGVEYTLLDPTPTDQMRSFCTDRPTKSNLPCTVDAGHLQYEADLFNWSYAHTSGTQTNTFLFTNPTWKLGLTNTLDFEVNLAPAERVTTRGPLGKVSLDGVGDLFLRTKINLAGPDGGDFQAAILPYVKVPTAKPGVGDKAFEGGVIGPLSFALPRDFTLLFDPEVDILRNVADAGRHANFQTLANLSHALSSSVTGYVELWGQVNDDPAATTHQASLDIAVSWVAWDKLPNLQLDLGANIGLTAVTPRLQAYTGISQRF